MVSTLEATNLDLPITPANSKLLHIPDIEIPSLYTTPEENILEDEPHIPLKDSAAKKKGSRIGSKRKLFLQTGTPGKVKKLPSPSIKTSKKIVQSPLIASPVNKEASFPNYPLTERQQLQYLLEVTAKDAQNKEANETDSDEATQSQMFTRLKKKDVAKKEGNTLRISKRNERGETLLHLAAIRGDLEETIDLIKAGITVNFKDYAGWTPLHEACNFGHLEIVEELVKGGANVNSPGYEDISPLHDAVINNHVQVVELLLKYGADPQQKTMQGFTAIDLARSASILELLQSAKQVQNVLISSAVIKQPDTTHIEHNTSNNGLVSSTANNDCKPTVLSDTSCQDTAKGSFIKDNNFRLGSMLSRRSSTCSCSSVPNSDIDDNIDPARLNECLDKAMIQMSSYLDPKKDCFDYGLHNGRYSPMVTPSAPSLVMRPKGNDERVSKQRLENSNQDNVVVPQYDIVDTVLKLPPRNDKLVEDKNPKTDVSSSNKENQSPTKTVQWQDKTLNQNQPQVDCTRLIEPDHQDSCKSSLECVGHIKNPTWRKALAKYYYNASNLPLFVPGYTKFMMKNKSYALHPQDDLSKRIAKDDKNKENSQLHRLETQQQTEREKLRLCLEQEIVRLFSNFARVAVNKGVPFGACTVLQHQMLSHDREKAKHQSSISLNDLSRQTIKAEVENLLQKFEKRKVELLTRQRHEFDAIIALQNLGQDLDSQGHGITAMDCIEWKLDDFEVTPEGFKECYEQFMSLID